MVLKKKSLCFAMNLGNLLAFQNLQEVNCIFKMATSIDLMQVRILIFGFL